MSRVVQGTNLPGFGLAIPLEANFVLRGTQFVYQNQLYEIDDVAGGIPASVAWQAIVAQFQHDIALHVLGNAPSVMVAPSYAAASIHQQVTREMMGGRRETREERESKMAEHGETATMAGGRWRGLTFHAAGLCSAGDAMCVVNCACGHRAAFRADAAPKTWECHDCLERSALQATNAHHWPMRLAGDSDACHLQRCGWVKTSLASLGPDGWIHTRVAVDGVLQVLRAHDAIGVVERGWMGWRPPPKPTRAAIGQRWRWRSIDLVVARVSDDRVHFMNSTWVHPAEFAGNDWTYLGMAIDAPDCTIAVKGANTLEARPLERGVVPFQVHITDGTAKLLGKPKTVEVGQLWRSSLWSSDKMCRVSMVGHGVATLGGSTEWTRDMLAFSRWEYCGEAPNTNATPTDAQRGISPAQAERFEEREARRERWGAFGALATALTAVLESPRYARERLRREVDAVLDYRLSKRWHEERRRAVLACAEFGSMDGDEAMRIAAGLFRYQELLDKGWRPERAKQEVGRGDPLLAQDAIPAYDRVRGLAR